jgi:hypothetical protein
VALADREVECYYIRGLAWALLARCDEAWPVLQQALQINPGDLIKGFINEGLMLCVNYDENYSMEDVPTPVPTEPVAPEPIGIF